MYPQGFATRVAPEGPALAGLEDKFRPHFFGGVATVVAKLFTQVRPDFALFGEKDYQQLKVVTRMAADLDLRREGDRREDGARERDGLALSSRNVYLSDDERAHGRDAVARAESDRRSAAQGRSRWRRRWRPDGARSNPPALRSIISRRATPRRWRRLRR